MTYTSEPATIASLIDRLQAIKEEHGDLEVRVWSTEYDAYNKVQQHHYPVCNVFPGENMKKIVVIL